MSPDGPYSSAREVLTATVVNDLGDAGPGDCTSTCTLRDAVAGAGAGAAIGFAPELALPATITLIKGEIAVATSFSIKGPGAAKLSISGGNASRIFNIGGGTLSISDLAIRSGTAAGGAGFGPGPGTGTSGGSGDPASGGCLFIAAGAGALLDRVDLRDCLAQGGDGGDGGSGVDNSGSLNTSGGDGGAGGPGGAASGGAIGVAGTLTLLDSSVSNSAAIGGAGGTGGAGGLGGLAAFNGNGGNGSNGGNALGGAIFVDTGASLRIANSTIARSHANGGGGGNGGAATSGSSSIHSGHGGIGGNAQGGLVDVNGSAVLADVEFSTLAEGGLVVGVAGAAGLASGGASSGGAGAPGTASGFALLAQTGVTTLSSVVVGSTAGALCSGAFSIPAGGINLDQDSSCSGFTLHAQLDAAFLPFDAAQSLPAYRPRYQSAVIGAAATCKDIGGSPVADDEHGTSRPQGSACDLGAIEADYIFVATF